MAFEFEDLEIGSAVAQPGKVTTGWLDGAELALGFTEKLPVMIARGREPGPTFWFTANIHGNEYTGIPALHDTLTAELTENLRGTVVAILSLNPSGLRTKQRGSHYDGGDPNRAFPEYAHADADLVEREVKHPSVNQTVMGKVYEEIMRSADFLIDLHCYSRVSTSFSIRDRVLYRKEEEVAEAERLQNCLGEMIQAFGLPVVNEYDTARYVRDKLHRSTSGIALNQKRIPACTVELGASDYIDPNALEACKTGILNVLVWAGMLEGRLKPVTTVPVPRPNFEVRRENSPRTPVSGLLRPEVRPGDMVEKGQVVAKITDMFGQELAVVESEEDGWIISLTDSLVVYQGQPVANTALRDRAPLVAPFPA